MSLSVVSTVADPSTLVAVARGKGRIGKTLHWAPEGSTDGIWRPDDDGRAGAWRKPSDLNAGADQQVGKNFEWHLYDIGDLARRLSLRAELSGREDTAMILSVISPDFMDRFKAVPHTTDHWTCPFGVLPRQSKKSPVFIDSPRGYLTIDIDDLDLRKLIPDIDVLESDDELGDLLADAFDHIGLDWLIGDCAIHLSSSHGLANRHMFKGHVEWRLSEPLSLAQQKAVVFHINEKAIAAGFGRIADTVIYNPDRLLFTSPTLLQKRVWLPDKGIITEIMPPLHIQRTRLITRGAPFTTVPSEALILTPDQKAAQVRTLTRKPGTGQAAAAGRKAAGAPADSTLKPGNVYSHIRAQVYKLALRTPERHAERELTRLRTQLTAAITAMPDNDDVKLTSRLRYLTRDELRRSWDDALAKRRPWVAAEDTARRAQFAPADARTILSKTVDRCITQAIDAYNGQQEAAQDDALISTPPPPIHTLIRVPPGVGKTHAALASIQHPHLTLHRISYLAPTTRLSEEATARRAATLPPGDEYAVKLVRQHKGRAQLCEEPAYGRLAAKVEKLGRSPLTSVCGHCPRRDACKWPAQHADKGSGLVAGQHAHATSSMTRLALGTPGAPTFVIVDESMMGTLLQETQKPRKMKTLRGAVSKTAIRGKDGSTIRGSTTDAITYRTRALDILERSKRTVSTKDVAWFKPEITVKRGEERRLVRRIDDAIASEREVSRTADYAVKAALEDAHKANITGTGARAAERALSKASNALLASEWFLSLYRCIKASLDVPDRKHVAGLRVTAKGVRIHMRADLPKVMAGRHALWLDGTANEQVWQALLGRAHIESQVSEIPVEPGAYHLTQYPDRAYSKRMFELTDAQRADSAVQQMRRFILWLAGRHRKVLVVAQKRVKQALYEAVSGTQLPRDRRGYPTDNPTTVAGNVHFEHFNALRGLDGYKDFGAAVIIGRPLPNNADLELMTEALHYDDPAFSELISAGDNMIRGSRTIRTYAQAVKIPCEQHPDNRAEALRQQISDAEVQQAINRLRLYDRPATRPAEIHVFGQADTGLVAHAVQDWVDAQRENADILAATGIWAQGHAVASRLAGGLLSHLPQKNFERYLRRPAEVDTWPIWRVGFATRAAATQNISVNSAIAQTEENVLAAIRLASDLPAISAIPVT